MIVTAFHKSNLGIFSFLFKTFAAQNLWQLKGRASPKAEQAKPVPGKSRINKQKKDSLSLLRTDFVQSTGLLIAIWKLFQDLYMYNCLFSCAKWILDTVAFRISFAILWSTWPSRGGWLVYAIDGGGIFEYKIALIYSHFCSERGGSPLCISGKWWWDVACMSKLAISVLCLISVMRSIMKHKAVSCRSVIFRVRFRNCSWVHSVLDRSGLPVVNHRIIIELFFFFEWNSGWHSSACQSWSNFFAFLFCFWTDRTSLT